jgi:hypothetical protein
MYCKKRRGFSLTSGGGKESVMDFTCLFYFLDFTGNLTCYVLCVKSLNEGISL